MPTKLDVPLTDHIQKNTKIITYISSSSICSYIRVLLLCTLKTKLDTVYIIIDLRSILMRRLAVIFIHPGNYPNQTEHIPNIDPTPSSKVLFQFFVSFILEDATVQPRPNPLTHASYYIFCGSRLFRNLCPKACLYIRNPKSPITPLIDLHSSNIPLLQAHASPAHFQ